MSDVLALDAIDVDHIEWDAFVRDVFVWKQGEHVSLIGPTGLGKTTLMLGILPMRSYVCLLASKPKDRTLAGLVKREKYQQVKAWPPPMSRAPMRNGKPSWWRVLLWPTFRRLQDTKAQAAAFRHALHEMFGQGGWTVAADDTSYLCRIGLAPEFEAYWLQGRSVNLSLVASIQRPAWVPLYCYSQATHLFFWRTNDRRDLKTIGGLNGADDKLVQHIVQRLAKHDVLYVNTRTGRMAVTRAERR